MKTLIVYLYFLISLVCVAQNTSQLSQAVAPNWVTKRPVSNSKFIGISFADKTTNSSYQSEAKKNALFDLSSEIKVNISTNSILYTVQNNNQFNENFNSLIKVSNSDNIEGYRLVDTYENDKQYWLYYELDKAEYEKRKQQKKQQTIDKALNIVNLSFDDEANGNFTGSLKKRIQAFGVLSPYLNEELSFDGSSRIKNIFDLSNIIQNQIQSISIAPSKVGYNLKPYQPSYYPMACKLVYKSKNVLVDCPFIIKSDNDNIKIIEGGITNMNGELEINVKKVTPLNQEVAFNLTPNFEKLMDNDSVSTTAIPILKQFIETSPLKVFARVSPITIYLTCAEKILTANNQQKIIQPFIKEKFNGEEVKFVDQKNLADFSIEVDASSQKDISSDVLFANYSTQLAFLKASLVLRNLKTQEVLFNTEIADVYGYGNSLETASYNAYQSEKLKTKLSEALFFLKRKLIVY